MKTVIGCPKEIKNNENRVGITPNAAKAYCAAGHEVYIEKGAGLGCAISDAEYVKAGAKIAQTAKEVWDKADMLVKVKEPLESEYSLMREGQLIYTYFHFAANEPLLNACLKQKCISLAYETVIENGALPLLKPMSEVAGRMSVLMGAFYSARPFQGKGLLPTGVTGVAPADILILGGGAVGTNAAHIAAGLGAKVTILDVNLSRMEYLSQIMPPNVVCIYSDEATIEAHVKTADIIIGAILIPGAKAPKLIRKEHLKEMGKGTVIVDVAIDQGGCFETSHATTHSEPTYVVDDVVHYCVANMPGAYPRTSAFALNNATIKYGLTLAELGTEQACKKSAAIKEGLNTYKGIITYKPVAEAFNLLANYKSADEVLK